MTLVLLALWQVLCVWVGPGWTSPETSPENITEATMTYKISPEDLAS